jgi:hypothetical protein
MIRHIIARKILEFLLDESTHAARRERHVRGGSRPYPGLPAITAAEHRKTTPAR